MVAPEYAFFYESVIAEFSYVFSMCFPIKETVTSGYAESITRLLDEKLDSTTVLSIFKPL